MRVMAASPAGGSNVGPANQPRPRARRGTDPTTNGMQGSNDGVYSTVPTLPSDSVDMAATECSEHSKARLELYT